MSLEKTILLVIAVLASAVTLQGATTEGEKMPTFASPSAIKLSRCRRVNSNRLGIA